MPDTVTFLVDICVRFDKRTVGVTTLAVASSPSACAFKAAAAKSCVCHSCSVAWALVLAIIDKNGVTVGEIRVIVSIKSSRLPIAEVDVKVLVGATWNVNKSMKRK